LRAGAVPANVNRRLFTVRPTGNVDPLALVTHNWTIVFKKHIGTLE
jgi:hypothetical protein